MNPERIGCGDIDPKERDPWDEIETTSANDVECRRDVPGEVKVRSLRPGFDDLDRVANLVYQVDPYVCSDFFGDPERAKEIGKVLFSEEGGLFDPSRVLVAERDGAIVGVLVYSDNTVKPWDSEGFKKKVDGLGIELPEHFDKVSEGYMKPVCEEAADLPDGAATVEFCATDEASRGQGVASGLFKEFLSLPQYHEQRLKVVKGNEAAVRLYSKFGFKVISEQPDYPDGSVVTYEMVRKAEEHN